MANTINLLERSSISVNDLLHVEDAGKFTYKCPVSSVNSAAGKYYDNTYSGLQSSNARDALLEILGGTFVGPNAYYIPSPQETVTVGDTGDFSTLEEALTYFERKVALSFTSPRPSVKFTTGGYFRIVIQDDYTPVGVEFTIGAGFDLSHVEVRHENPTVENIDVSVKVVDGAKSPTFCVGLQKLEARGKGSVAYIMKDRNSSTKINDFAEVNAARFGQVVIRISEDVAGTIQEFDRIITVGSCKATYGGEVVQELLEGGKGQIFSDIPSNDTVKHFEAHAGGKIVLSSFSGNMYASHCSEVVTLNSNSIGFINITYSSELSLSDSGQLVNKIQGGVCSHSSKAYLPFCDIDPSTGSFTVDASSELTMHDPDGSRGKTPNIFCGGGSVVSLSNKESDIPGVNLTIARAGRINLTSDCINFTGSHTFNTFVPEGLISQGS